MRRFDNGWILAWHESQPTKKRRLRAPFKTAQGLELTVKSDTNLPQGRIANARLGTASASPLLVLTAP